MNSSFYFYLSFGCTEKYEKNLIKFLEFLRPIVRVECCYLSLLPSGMGVTRRVWTSSEKIWNAARARLNFFWRGFRPSWVRPCLQRCIQKFFEGGSYFFLKSLSKLKKFPKKGRVRPPKPLPEYTPRCPRHWQDFDYILY